jgi:hypothetical protein
MTPRELILSEILEERILQASRFSAEHDSCHACTDWVSLLCRHLGLAVDDEAEVTMWRYRRQLIRVAATALAALEALDLKYPTSRAVGQPPEERTAK